MDGGAGARTRVAIVGGGPGGARCAWRLAEAGLPVTVFEPRERFEKACGGGVPARGLERFPFLRDAGLPGKTIRDCLVISPSGREARFPLVDPLLVFGRADLHAFMLSRAAAAGARVERARVLSFEREAARGGPRYAVGRGGDAGPWTLRAVRPDGSTSTHGPFDFLVAADGASGIARRRLVPDGRPREVTQGIGCYVPQVSEDFITLKFFPDLHGYLWVFPRPDHSSAGICATLGSVPAATLRRLMDEFLGGRYPAAALDRSERYAALIPMAPRDPRDEPVQGPGWALVGDAARFVDPLTREGIYYAILSGDLLGAALAAGRPDAYADAWLRHGAAELSWAAAHGDGFFETGFLERLVFLASVSPSIGRILSDLIAGRQSYRTLKRRLLLNAPAVAAQAARRLFAPGRARL